MHIHDLRHASVQAVETCNLISVRKIEIIQKENIHVPLALRMEVYAAHSSLDLVEADVIEPLEAST